MGIIMNHERGQRMKYYLAVDIGASSGRHMLSWLENGELKLEEIHRFENGLVEKDGHLCWDLHRLFYEIKEGMRQCKATGRIPESMGIDTWAVDFVLLDEQENIVGNTVSYRDGRTKGCDNQLYKTITEEELYTRTGIQKQIFNSIYQLKAIQLALPEDLKRAKNFLMIPDYFNFLLTHQMAVEYTNATTTQLVSPITRDWDYELIHNLGYPIEIFTPILQPGTVLGQLTKEIADEVGFECKVVLPATHDTGSAVLAIPSNEENTIYISSGTWSLMGIEVEEADCRLESRVHNFSNEGGYGRRFRYLKNIMGLWMIQSMKREIGEGKSYSELCALAENETIPSIVDCNAIRFLAPKNMTEEVRQACRESGQQVPESLGEVAAVIYNSLARCYGITLSEIESLTGRTFEQINIVGGGANAQYLNELTAKVTGRKVYAGPTEATAIGNILAQMISDGSIGGMKEARELVRTSFDIKVYGRVRG